jgi:hypothetical protein
MRYTAPMTTPTQPKTNPPKPKPKAVLALEQTFQRLRTAKAANPHQFDPFFGSEEFRDL